MNIIEFMSKNSFEHEIIFARLAGSRSYGIHNENSDYDWAGVFAVDTTQFLGFDNNCEHIERSNTGDKNEYPDISFYEIGKFSRLLLVGNPNILEMLWCECNVFETTAWQVLRKNRNNFISKRAIHNYTGYAIGQIKRAISRRHDPHLGKWMTHTFRLLMDAESLISCHDIHVEKTGVDKNILLNYRNGAFNFDEAIKEAYQRIENIDKMLEMDNLPDEGDRAWLNQWVIDYRLNNLKK